MVWQKVSLLNLQEAPATNQLFQEPPLLDYEQPNTG